MKWESDNVVGDQTPPRRSYNPFDSDDEIEDTNGYLKSSLTGYDIRSFETNDDSLTFHLDSSDLSWEEAIVRHSQILSRAVPADSDCDEVLFRKDTELFTDKTVTDTELPEMMVYYKDNTYQSVKDIGIDEGMPLHDEVSIKSRDNERSKNSSSFRGLNGHINGDEYQELPYMEGLKARAADSNSEKDVSSSDWSSDSLKGSALNTEDLKAQETRADSNSDKDVSFGHWSNDSSKEGGLDTEALKAQEIADQIDIDESTKVYYEEHSSSKETSTFSRESTGVEVESGSVVGTGDPTLTQNDEDNGVKSEEKTDQVFKDQTNESSSVPSFANDATASSEFSESRNIEATTSEPVELPESQDSSDNRVGNSLSYNSKVESGSIILDFNSSDEATAEPDEAESEISVEKEEKKEDEQEKEEEKEEETSKHIETLERPPEAQTMSRHDERPDSIFNSGSENRVHGETSFSAAMSGPASITYMGPHAYTGSTSLRSESSAGSTRSFAFPVLHAEWNSSPVRMAKAEHRNFRKQRAWVHSLVCCRF